MLEHKLLVKRRLANGNALQVGELAENQSGIYFQYHVDYLQQYKTLAPFTLKSNIELQKGPLQPHKKLHGVFADSLPDGWGLYLMDRVFRKNGYNPQTLTQLERLAFIGDNCLGALFYEPRIALNEEPQQHDLSIRELGKLAVEEFEGTESDLVEYLMNTAGSGGARPKINATLLADGTYTTNPNTSGEKCIIKLTSDKFALKHEESLVEYCFMKFANQCGIETAEFDLVSAPDNHFWLRQTRFDCVGENGRLHMISASGLLDASFREPSLDYIDLIKATHMMCSATEARKLLQRALFNYLICNQDDHAKNFAFLCDDKDNWRLSPFYDVLYSPSPYGQHMTAFNGDGKGPDKKTLELMARHAGMQPKRIKPMVELMMDELMLVEEIFRQTGVSQQSSNSIVSTVNRKWNTLKQCL